MDKKNNVIAAFGNHNGMSVDQSLASAKEADLTDVLIIGYDSDGEMIIRSSAMTRRDSLWMLEKAKEWTLYGNND